MCRKSGIILMKIMIIIILLLLYWSFQFVDVQQEVVLKACLANGDDTVKKVSLFHLSHNAKVK